MHVQRGLILSVWDDSAAGLGHTVCLRTIFLGHHDSRASFVEARTPQPYLFVVTAELGATPWMIGTEPHALRFSSLDKPRMQVCRTNTAAASWSACAATRDGQLRRNLATSSSQGLSPQHLESSELSCLLLHIATPHHHMSTCTHVPSCSDCSHFFTNHSSWML